VLAKPNDVADNLPLWAEAAFADGREKTNVDESVRSRLDEFGYV